MGARGAVWAGRARAGVGCAGGNKGLGCSSQRSEERRLDLSSFPAPSWDPIAVVACSPAPSETRLLRRRAQKGTTGDGSMAASSRISGCLACDGRDRSALRLTWARSGNLVGCLQLCVPHCGSLSSRPLVFVFPTRQVQLDVLLLFFLCLSRSCRTGCRSQLRLFLTIVSIYR